MQNPGKFYKKPVLKKSISTPNIAESIAGELLDTSVNHSQFAPKKVGENRTTTGDNSSNPMLLKNVGEKEEVWEELFYYYYENFLNQALDAMQKKMERDKEENGGKRLRS